MYSKWNIKIKIKSHNSIEDIVEGDEDTIGGKGDPIFYIEAPVDTIK